jgi:hypothetical protein
MFTAKMAKVVFLLDALSYPFKKNIVRCEVTGSFKNVCPRALIASCSPQSRPFPDVTNLTQEAISFLLPGINPTFRTIVIIVK